jgi:integral membrane protein
MKNFFTTKIGRLRIIAFLEGISLLILVGMAVPLKYIWNEPVLSYYMGRIHGVLFVLFVLNVFSVAIEFSWKGKKTAQVMLISCFIPFGTFYIDRQILRNNPEH